MTAHWEFLVLAMGFGLLGGGVLVWWVVRCLLLLQLDRRWHREAIYRGLRAQGRVPWHSTGAHARPNLRVVRR